MAVLIEVARHRGLKTMHATILAENRRMLKFVTDLGFELSSHPEDPSLRRAALGLN
jgi:L-amino acid N-acyltransferase YncA